MSKQRIVTVHGINTEGEWQASVKRVLEPHFECVPFKYDEYRRRGELLLLLSSWKFVLAVWVIAAVAIWMLFRHLVLFAIPMLALAACVAACCVWKHFSKRKALSNRFAEWLSSLEEKDGPPPPHVIAHSFGTFLTGHALGLPATTFRSAVLTGCVLSAKFEWKELIESKQVAEVRNEVGKRDGVAWLAGIAYWMIPDLGNAGWAGFKSKDGSVHDCKRAFGPCDPCRTGARAMVHNIIISKFTHSDHFILPGHARKLWLPFLWGLDLNEYRLFVERCLWAVRYEKEMRECYGDSWYKRAMPDDPLILFEAELHEWRWQCADWLYDAERTWRGKTLREFLEEHFTLLLDYGAPAGQSLPGLVDRAVRQVWQEVWKADAARRKNQSDRKTVLALHPNVAARRAAEWILAERILKE